MDPAALGLAAGAVLSGLGSFVAAAGSIRSSKKRSADDCDKRIAEMKEALKLGMTLQEREEEDERWSHLP